MKNIFWNKRIGAIAACGGLIGSFVAAGISYFVLQKVDWLLWIIMTIVCQVIIMVILSFVWKEKKEKVNA